ncbi:unnamed protein product, partial [Amoebophrya sp. A120]
RRNVVPGRDAKLRRGMVGGGVSGQHVSQHHRADAFPARNLGGLQCRERAHD